MKIQENLKQIEYYENQIEQRLGNFNNNAMVIENLSKAIIAEFKTNEDLYNTKTELIQLTDTKYNFRCECCDTFQEGAEHHYLETTHYTYDLCLTCANVFKKYS